MLENVASGQRAVWLMSGVTRTSSVYLPAAPASWKIVGRGDFNSDGRTDLVFRILLRGAAVWYLNGTTFSSGAYLPSALGAWDIAGAGDFDDDGKPDLVLQDSSSGSRVLWLLNGLGVTNTIFLPSARVQGIFGIADRDFFPTPIRA